MPRPKKSQSILEIEKKLSDELSRVPKVSDQKPIAFDSKTVVASEELHDVNLANGVKVGHKQLTYIHSENYSLDLHKGRLAIRLRTWGPEEKTVYTTINNIMYWR